MESVSRLKTFLAKLTPGKITDASTVQSLLADCWSEFSGSSDEKMVAYKLDRMKGVEWHPPKLSFAIERHGGTVMGSTRAEMQGWVVDVEQRSAACGNNRYRQLKARDAAVHVDSIVARLVEAILSGREDSGLQWLEGHREVRTVVSTLITGDYKQTLEGRRKRFRVKLDKQLTIAGWTKAPRRRDVYERTTVG